MSTWKERQPTSANCIVTVLVPMTNCINPSVLKGKMKWKHRLDAKDWLYLVECVLV